MLLVFLSVATSSLHAGFFQIDSIASILTPPKDGVAVWKDQLGPTNKPSQSGFMPSLKVVLHPQQNIASKDVTVRGYFFDQSGKMIRQLDKPSMAGKGNFAQSLPMILKSDQTNAVFFQIPKELKASDARAVIVFGDKDEAIAITYPQTLSESSFDYPDKKLVEDYTLKNIKRKPAVDPLVEYVAKSYVTDAKHPQVTLFLRMPNGVSDPSELQGVLVVCVLWTGLDVARRDMQQPEMAGDYKGLFNYANAHKLAILAWGGPGHHWDPTKNYDAMTQKAEKLLDDDLNEVADTWEKGVSELTEKYNLPKKDYLLWGVCRSSQWAQRLCLRKPDYFLATYMLIPGSFDKPTPEASKVIWCLCTGELYGGYQNALKWYKECRAMGYPMLFKAYVGLGHATSTQSLGMAFKFFDFALTQKDLRDEHDKAMASRIAQAQLAASGLLQGPWPESFRNPPFYGDIVNQEVYPADQVKMIPEGFRTPLPTKELADYWGLSK